MIKKVLNFYAKISCTLYNMIELVGQMTPSHWQDVPCDTLLTFFPGEHKAREA